MKYKDFKLNYHYLYKNNNSSCVFKVIEITKDVLGDNIHICEDVKNIEEGKVHYHLKRGWSIEDVYNNELDKIVELIPDDYPEYYI